MRRAPRSSRSWPTTECVAVLVIASTQEPRFFSSLELDALMRLADETAPVLARVRSEDALRTALEREKLVAEIARKVRSELDLDAVLHVAVTETGRSLDVARCFIRLGAGGRGRRDPRRVAPIRARAGHRRVAPAGFEPGAPRAAHRRDRRRRSERRSSTIRGSAGASSCSASARTPSSRRRSSSSTARSACSPFTGRRPAPGRRARSRSRRPSPGRSASRSTRRGSSRRTSAASGSRARSSRRPRS